MNVEQSRLNTFLSWPANAEVEPQRIAKAGFYYTGTGLEVECFSCGHRISDWNYGDQVMARHRQLNSECLFVKDPVTSGNIPVVNRSPSLYSQLSESSQSNATGTSLQASGDFPSYSSPNVNRNVGESSSVLLGSGSATRNSVSDNLCDSSIASSPHSIPDITSPSPDTIATYKSEAARLSSFASWPKSHIVSPRLLARTGFFYLQNTDRVQCAFCLGKVCGWEPGDDPEREHRRHFPSCPMHCNMAVGNIPLVDTNINIENIQQAHSSNSSDVVQEVRPFSVPERDGLAAYPRDVLQPRLGSLGIHSHSGPKYPKYSTIESRLRTFVNWPATVSQTPQQLAQAGFYYTGTHDQVRCFHCDGGLRQWDVHDDPWTEHARWFSKCTYVLLVKGEEFVHRAIIQHPPHLPADEIQRRVNDPLPVEQAVYRMHNVTDEELNNLMGTPPVQAALDVGLDPSKIKQVLRQRLEHTGLPFTSSDTLIEAVLDLSSNTASPEIPATENTSHSTVAETERIQRSISERTEEFENSEEQHIPLSISKSLPSIGVCGYEPSFQGREVTALSMPHLLQEKCAKKIEENEFTLEEENRRLKEARLCKICMDEEVGVVFVPCGHLVTCANCAANVEDCPMCRQPIKATVRTFLS